MLDRLPAAAPRSGWMQCLLLSLSVLFISIIAGGVDSPLIAQDVTAKEPARLPADEGRVPAASAPTSQSREAGQAQADAVAEGQDDLARTPRAVVLPPEVPAQRAVIESDLPQTRHGDVYAASGGVVLTYGDHVLRADSLTYDMDSNEVVATGHVRLTGGENDEDIHASHGTYNLKTQAGRFYDVSGSIHLTIGPSANLPMPTQIAAQSASGFATGGTRLPSYQNGNPFVFEGRIVVKTGPTNYVVYNGSVTSCLLPKPDWQLFARKITVDNSQAKASSSTFELLGIPLVFLPYVTHPTNTDQRQSGLLIPEFSYSSASDNTGSKGLTIGDQYYLSLGRSQDLTLGLLYYSLRGFSENATYRLRGLGEDFLTGHFSALQDRGFYAPYTFVSKGKTTTRELFTNQGGQDVTAAFRKQLAPNLRFVGDGEYLSSYIYREVFTENFNQAVSTDILSTTYLTLEQGGYAADFRLDRYEGLKVVPVNLTPGEIVKIYHAPSIDFSGLDHRIAQTPLVWSMTASAAGLKRVQPNFVSSGMIERLDLRPELALPLAFKGWHTLSYVALEDTYYTRSRKEPYGPNATPVELKADLNRADVELNIDIRPPVLERTFQVPAKWQWLLGTEVRHTIEPDITYKNVHGVDNFLKVLRFDDLDLVSDTDELQYALLQHLYFRPRAKKAAQPKPGCPAKAQPAVGDKVPDTDVQSQPAEETAGDQQGAAGNQQTAAGAAEKEKTADELLRIAEEEQQPTLDANGIPNAAAKAPDMPTRTHARRNDPCAEAATLPPQREWFSWELAQKHFIAQNFGGAVIDARRNIFETTLDFSGIAFLTEARSTSPLISRMRFRTSGHTDVSWNFDYDTGASKFNSSNVFLDVHEGSLFGGFSYARLNAPGRFYTEDISTTTNEATGVTASAVSNFSQMRFLIGYGQPTRPGISAAAGAGIDLIQGTAQYVTVQASYNWNCCGLSLEYRKYDLGTVRNEGTYSFNFTLANIGSAGNLRRAQSLF
jgi:LPS-assembly protein